MFAVGKRRILLQSLRAKDSIIYQRRGPPCFLNAPCLCGSVMNSLSKQALPVCMCRGWIDHGPMIICFEGFFRGHPFCKYLQILLHSPTNSANSPCWPQMTPCRSVAKAGQDQDHREVLVVRIGDEILGRIFLQWRSHDSPLLAHG